MRVFVGRSVGGLVLSRGRSGEWRLDALEGATSVLLDSARGVWLAEGVLRVRSGASVETLLWDREADGAERVVTRRLAETLGARRAERRLRELERKAVV